MTDTETTNAFEANRAHLRAVAYQLLGSVPEAEDAVQEAWLRLARSQVDEVRDLRAWLTTVVARVALDMLRSRTVRRESAMPAGPAGPPGDLIGVAQTDTGRPEAMAIEADSVGLAMLVVVETLSPAERLAFVLHDVFAVPFEQIGAITGRSTSAAKQLASRARRRVKQTPSVAAVTAARQQRVLSAFLAASRDGDFTGLVALLDPDVVMHSDAGAGSPLSQTVRGATAVGTQARRYAALAESATPVTVDGVPALLAAPNGRPFALITVVVRDDRIVELNILADAEKLAAMTFVRSAAAGQR